ncbi:MAG TPA: type I restriction endonuclease subunit R [Syntrophorhabdaceae bacterium]|nr:type I restriction endonuclease subunit R [Syntrophorhabdaceae bacterium]HRV21548.1 type I restriction endonuclease subunit R [Syntrophorhabdaceae bacterium]
MPVSDTSEAGLERLICRTLTGSDCEPYSHISDMIIAEPNYAYGGSGWIAGNSSYYDREYCVDLFQLSTFLQDTQPEIADAVDIKNDSPTRRQFLARLQGEISKRGVIDILRNGIKHGPYDINLFYGAPSPGNETAKKLYELNRFSVTRQLKYSREETQRALDIVLFINGLPVFTFELKNSLTKQTIHDAISQYMRDRDPREKLFEFGRCIAHFAVDDQEVRFCTHLKGKESWFLPFNKGYNDGAGNPPNPDGIKTEYLWREILTRESLTDIIENYAQIIEMKDQKTGKKKRKQIFPRYHQLDVVRKLLSAVKRDGVGKRYLIQHSAGSGKSNSIAWLAYQLIGVKKDGIDVFDSIIVVTDRRILDTQIQATIKQFAQVKSTVGHAERSTNLREFIESGKKIIITTLQKFPFILDEIGTEHTKRRFAIIIDEAHSSQGGRTTAKMHQVLAGAADYEEDDTFEDKINKIIETKKLLPNASYFAFTATPKNKTLELFGDPLPQPDGKVKHRPFHSYTMKQAIQEGFILDVLANYTPVKSYYKLMKKIEDDPEFDVKKAQKKLLKYVENHDYAIRQKAEIMVDHFHQYVAGAGKIGGQARAMIITSGIKQAIRYFYAIDSYLKERNSPYRAIVAFSGEHEFEGKKVSEFSLNGFPSNQIADKFKEDPYRFLICADKFQTGYDEELLHTMYVDKPLSDIKAVQTLSRLNRSHPKKHDTFILDFVNDPETIKTAFEPYYRTTILSEETDPNKLHDLKAELDSAGVYTWQEVEGFVKLYLDGVDREKLDPILDSCVSEYLDKLDEDGQVNFKGNAKAFIRVYAFLSQILPYKKRDWEILSIFLNFLVPKLPAPKEEDLSKGILEAIDMESYRVEKKSRMRIQLEDEEGEIMPIPAVGGVHKPETLTDRLSNIIKTFNEQYGNISWTDTDRVRKLITEDIPARVSADTAYQNAIKYSDRQNARIEHDRALLRVMTNIIKDDTELFKQFSDNEGFRRWLTDTIFQLTYEGRYLQKNT